MSYFGGVNSGFNNFGFPGLGGTFNLGNSAYGLTDFGNNALNSGFNLGNNALNSGFNLGNNAPGFNGLGGLNSGFNLGNNANGFAFGNNFGGANTQIATPRQGCPPGCYYPMPGEPCTQGICPNGCCELG